MMQHNFVDTEHQQHVQNFSAANRNGEIITFSLQREKALYTKQSVDSGMMFVTAIRSQPAILLIQFRWGFLKFTCSILSPQKQTL